MESFQNSGIPTQDIQIGGYTNALEKLENVCGRVGEVII